MFVFKGCPNFAKVKHQLHNNAGFLKWTDSFFITLFSAATGGRMEPKLHWQTLPGPGLLRPHSRTLIKTQGREEGEKEGKESLQGEEEEKKKEMSGVALRVWECVSRDVPAVLSRLSSPTDVGEEG